MKIVQLVKIVSIIILVWVVQSLFLHEVINNGIHGDDLNALFWFHAHRGNLLGQFFYLWNDKTIYIFQQIYYMGLLQAIFGFFNYPPVQLIHLLFKTLAGLSLAFLIYKLVNDRVFAILTAFFFIISFSTTGIFIALAQGTSYLALVFMSFFALFYFQSLKQPKKILLSSLFFFLALITCPPRAFPIILIPLIVEAVRYKKDLKFFVSLRRLMIFYILPYILLSRDSGHVAGRSWIVHLQDFTNGNYYSITSPFQIISSLYIDTSFLERTLPQWTIIDLNVILVLQLILLPISILLGLIVKFKNLGSFLIKITLSTLFLQFLFFIFGSYSHDLPFDGGIIQQVAFNKISFSKASFGGYFAIFGLFLVLEWWKNQRKNKIMMVLSGAWFWMILSLTIIWFSAGGVSMAEAVDRRYVLTTSLGSTVFSAGIFALLMHRILKISKLPIKVLFFILLGISLVIISYTNYQYLNNYFRERNQITGTDGAWQKNMYQRFVSKFGQANLYKDALIYIDDSKSNKQDQKFYINSVGGLYMFVFFDNGHLTRDTCKAIVKDEQVLKKSYKVINGKKGFLLDGPPTICVEPLVGYNGRTTFYPLDNFYAYSVENREFIDIKESVLSNLSLE